MVGLTKLSNFNAGCTMDALSDKRGDVRRTAQFEFGSYVKMKELRCLFRLNMSCTLRICPEHFERDTPLLLSQVEHVVTRSNLLLPRLGCKL